MPPTADHAALLSEDFESRLNGEDTLETELASLLLQQSPAGWCRIQHHQDGKHHDDRAFALGAACLFALEHAGRDDWLLMTEPTRDGRFAL